MILNFDHNGNFFVEESGEYVFRKLQEDIAASQWYIDYRGFPVNDDIFILPVTSHYNPGSDYSYILYLDALNAFGDGRHPTTFMCLNALHRVLSEDPSPAGLLDIGTGTGVLSILASKMGCRDISALDIVPEAVENARYNASMNGCDDIAFFTTDIAFFAGEKRRFRIITANLLPPVILENIDLMTGLLDTGGTMILSGISELRAGEIESLFAPRGLEVKDHLVRERWHCYVLNVAR